MTDTPFLKRILLACSRGGVRLFRNNVGQGWVGRSTRITKSGPVFLQAGDVVVRQARPLHAGLVKGSGDLIGWRTVQVTQDMVGQQLAQFVSVEAKEGSGRLAREQKLWRDAVRDAGGVAEEVRSVEDVERALG